MATNKRIDGTLTAEQLRKALDYDPKNGAFTWRHRDDVSSWVNTRFAGKPAGCSTPRGYLNIGVYGPLYMADRLAWLYVHDEWPVRRLEHIDGNLANNALDNLRIAHEPMGAAELISAERLRELVDYDPETGMFRWSPHLRDTRNGHRAGKPAGHTCKTHGYVVMTVAQQHYKAHRLAWLYVHGTHPVGLIDHINGNRSDNRMVNLRDVTPSQNNINRGADPNNTSGMKGASWSETNQRWLAHISFGAQTYHLGFFDTVAEAHAAYRGAAVIAHGAYARSAD